MRSEWRIEVSNRSEKLQPDFEVLKVSSATQIYPERVGDASVVNDDILTIAVLQRLPIIDDSTV